MFNSCGPNPIVVFVRATCVAILFSSVCIAQAEKSANSWPKYDLKSETKIKGTIGELKPISNLAKPAMEVTLKSDTGTVEVYLCPKEYLKDMGIELKSGDELEIKGSKVKQGGIDVILGREVIKGNDTIILRDDKGAPVWSWRKT